MRALALASALFALVPGRATAQSTPPAPPAAGRVDYLTRFAFHFGAEHLSSDDPLYVWDANYGGEVDLVDYRAGRAIFYANYQVILGEELHAFDPNQGNYILGARVSARLHALEAALVFHHESRHLSDREKQQPVDWNMLGARLSRSFVWPRLFLDARADLRGVVQRSFVDYEWEIDLRAHGTIPVSPRVAVVSDVSLRHLGVDGSAGREGQTGARGEGGVRLSGGAGAVELFLAAERRIDPYPLQFGTIRWFSAGFRFVYP
ncbi:MAG TPA: hypothetical protein VFV95_05775 [Vicinamibacterales bacterium]|nr:hypothetical protein [Vicinamibacterales bacterium]